MRPLTAAATLAIAGVIRDTYGYSPSANALIDHLFTKIEADDWDSRGREHNVMLIVWNWYSGGDTAASVARKIEEALNA